MPPFIEPFELTYEDEPGRVVRGRVVRPAPTGPLPWVLVLHGFKGFMDWGFFPVLAERLADAGLAAVLFNTSGSGIGADLESFTEELAFARGTLSRQLEDIARVREHVLRGALGDLDPERAGLFGHSRGGGMGLVHAAESGDYRAVVTWAAMDDADRYSPSVKAAWRRAGTLPVVNSRTGQVLGLGVEVLEDFERHRDRFDIPAACRRLEAPTLLVHGLADDSVEPRALERLARALPRRETLAIPGAGHTFGAVHPLENVGPELELALGKSMSWFQTHLTGCGRR
jgi:dipeptidyl aminopeptidase/acylaminoacyl peptidase